MIVIDASVAVKWFAPEPGHDDALSLLSSSDLLLAPDILIAETMHALRRKLRSGDIIDEQFIRAGSEIAAFLDQITPSSALAEEATRLSIRLDHGFYDCLYLALALTSGSVLVTADEVFAAKAVAAGFDRSVRVLGETDGLGPPVEIVSDELVEEIHRLAGRISATFRALGTPTQASDRFPAVSSKAYLPAFDSPAYRRLTQLIMGLSASELVHVVALGWFGRDYERGNFEPLIENAQRFAGSRERDIRYIVSIMGTVRAGVEKLRSREMPVRK